MDFVLFLQFHHYLSLCSGQDGAQLSGKTIDRVGNSHDYMVHRIARANVHQFCQSGE
jgi:hypothetical protein